MGTTVVAVVTLVLPLLATLAPVACSGSPDEGVPPSREDGTRSEEARFWQEFRAATAARAAGDREAAIRGYEAALERRPGHADSRYYAAQLHYGRGEIQAALTHLQQLAEVEPRGLRAWQQLSVVRGTPVPGWVPDLEGAVAAAREAIRLNPSESRSHLLAARWAAYAGDRETAHRELETALGHNPDLEEGYLLQVWLEAAAGDVGRARQRGDAGLGELCDPDSCRRAAALQLALVSLPAGPGSHRLDPFRAPASPRLTRRSAVNWRAGVDGMAVLRAASPQGATIVDTESSPTARAALEVLRPAAGPPVLIRGNETDDPRVLPAAVPVPGWSDGDDSAGPRPAPWRSAVLRTPTGEELWLLGGGPEPLRRYRSGEGRSWRPGQNDGLPEPVSGAALAAFDLDGDGADEVFLSDVLLAEADRGAGAPGDVAGVVLGADASGRWVRRGSPVPGSWRAAAAMDLDGDGDDDLVLARDPGSHRATGQLLRRAGAAEEDDGLPVSTVTALRNDAGTLRPAPGLVPYLQATVQDLRPLSVGGAPALFLATGGLAPERPEPDRLWVWRDGRWVDDSPRLGSGRFARTLRAIPTAPGRLLLLRGGLLPADPPSWTLLEVAAADDLAVLVAPRGLVTRWRRGSGASPRRGSRSRPRR